MLLIRIDRGRRFPLFSSPPLFCIPRGLNKQNRWETRVFIVDVVEAAGNLLFAPHALISHPKK